ncbi:MAG: tail fiber domain-containing protein, partial [Patescibacteria group bacterium]|nr:tail fiber domain-containing protein [Patescibacteria group bacterium]
PSQGMDVNGNVTANRYYDRNNTSYYMDPAGTSMLNTTYTHGAMYVGNSAADSTDIYIADRLYDWDNTGYYLDPGSTSRLNRTDITDLRTDIFYDRNNPAYYVNPAGTGTAAKFAGAVEIGDGKIYQSGGTMYIEAPWALQFESSNGMPTGSISVEGAAELFNDFGTGNLWLDGYAYGGRVGSIHLEGGANGHSWIGQGITVGDYYRGQYDSGNTPNPEANLARIHIKNLTIDYDILPIQTCQAGWTNIGNVGGGGATDCQQIAGLIVEDGRVGLGTKFPSYPLQMGSGAHVTTGGVWSNASSRELKENIIDLSSNEAMEALKVLQPKTYNYKNEPGEQYAGFIAEDVPSLIATNDRKSIAAMDVVAMLAKVTQLQQGSIEDMFLQTDLNLSMVSSTDENISNLQVVVDNITSEMLIDIQGELSGLHLDANAQSDLIDQLQVRIDILESDMDTVDLMQTELAAMMIALDEDKLIYTDDAGDLTLEGVINVVTVVADEVITDALVASSLQFTNDGDAPIIGQGTIGADTSEVVVDTTAVQSDSIVLLTPQSPLTQSLAVSQINCDDNDDNCTGFKVELSETIDESIGFNWFIVSAKKEDIK